MLYSQTGYSFDDNLVANFWCNIIIFIASLSRARCNLHKQVAQFTCSQYCKTVCDSNPTTSIICVCFMPDNYKAIIHSLFFSKVV